MNRRDPLSFGLALILVLLVSATAPAFPQAPAEGQDEGAPSEAVETILREQEQLLQGQRFSYDPGGRRDPFRSLFLGESLGKGPRPKGVSGMLVTEIDLVGIVKDDFDGDLCYFIGSDNKGYFLRVGDEVYDGTLIAIDARMGTVTFRQQVNDPRRIKPYVDQVKRLIPLGEESVNE